MTNQTSLAAQASTTAWVVSGLRLTLFLSDDSSGAKALGWEAALKELPEAVNSQMRLGVHEEVGPFKNGMLSYVVAPGRVEWRYGSTISPAAIIAGEASSMANLGSFDSSVEDVAKLVNEWLKIVPRTYRIAVGVTALNIVSGREQAYEQLARQLVGYVKVEPSSTDLQYQVNRARHSKVLGGLKINRLAKWAAIKAAIGFSLPSGERLNPRSEEHAAVVELDINTDGERAVVDALPADLLIPLVREMIKFAGEILNQGDIP